MDQYRIIKRVTPLLNPPHSFGYNVQKKHWLWGWENVQDSNYWTGPDDLFFTSVEKAEEYIEWEKKKKEWTGVIKNL
jgi:hypothetical protein